MSQPRSSRPPGPHNQRIVPHLRAEMARARVSQAQLASSTSLSQVALSRRIHGNVPMSVDELFELADALGCPVDALIRAPKAVSA